MEEVLKCCILCPPNFSHCETPTLWLGDKNHNIVAVFQNDHTYHGKINTYLDSAMCYVNSEQQAGLARWQLMALLDYMSEPKVRKHLLHTKSVYKASHNGALLFPLVIRSTGLIAA